MELSRISVEFNLQINIINSLYQNGTISKKVSEECIKRIKQRYINLVKSLKEEETK